MWFPPWALRLCASPEGHPPSAPPSPSVPVPVRGGVCVSCRHQANITVALPRAVLCLMPGTQDAGRSPDAHWGHCVAWWELSPVLGSSSRLPWLVQADLPSSSEMVASKGPASNRRGQKGSVPVSRGFRWFFWATGKQCPLCRWPQCVMGRAGGVLSTKLGAHEHGLLTSPESCVPADPWRGMHGVLLLAPHPHMKVVGARVPGCLSF